VRRSGSTHIVQRVGGIDGDQPAARLAQGNDRDGRIDRPGRLDQIGAADGRVHPRFVNFSERVWLQRALAHQPAAIVHLFRHVDRAEGDLRRPQQIQRAAHAVGDAPGHETLVVVEHLFGNVAVLAEGGSRGVGVGGGNQHVLRRDSRRLLDQPPRLDAHAAVQPEQIADHQRELGLAVVQHEAARVQLVVHVPGRIGREAADHQDAEFGRDVAGRRAGLQRRGRRRPQRQAENERDAAHESFSCSVNRDSFGHGQLARSIDAAPRDQSHG